MEIGIEELRNEMEHYDKMKIGSDVLRMLNTGFRTSDALLGYLQGMYAIKIELVDTDIHYTDKIRVYEHPRNTAILEKGDKKITYVLRHNH